MNSMNLDVFLQDISIDAPCGANLEYDLAFLELEQVVKGKPEVQYGGTITPATQADWKSVKTLCLDLLGRSRDLRVAVPLSRALLKLHGIAGFAFGLSLLEAFLLHRWDSVHPQLDPGDDNDPMLRINTLAALCEAGAVLRDVREAILFSSRAHGRFSLRNIDIATGELDTPAGEEKVALAVIDAALRDADLDDADAMCRALQAAVDSSIRIELVLTEQVGAAQALSLSPLTKLLRRAADFMRERLRARTATDAAQSVEPGPAPEEVEGAPIHASPAAQTGDIGSRDDVLRMLDKMCAYYAAQEPSSPIPLLLRRAHQLVNKSFIEVLQDLAPDGLNQLYQVSGTRGDV